MTNDGTPKPVESYGTAFQIRLGKILFDDWADEGEHLPESAHCPTCVTEITEALRETIQACKPEKKQITDFDKTDLGAASRFQKAAHNNALDEFETALLDALNG